LIDELIRRLKQGHINRKQFEREIRKIQRSTQSQIDGLWSNFYKDLSFEFLDAFSKSLEAFLPNPTDGSIGNGILDFYDWLFGGGDASIFRQ